MYNFKLISGNETNITGRDISVGIATRYGLNGSGNRIPVDTRFSAPVQTGPGGPPSILYNGYRAFLGGKAAGASLTTHPNLAPRSRKE
jgi:hypothetical protein